MAAAPDAMESATGVLIQYGAVGVVALMALVAVRVLYGRLSTALDREVARADRLEVELGKLNEAIRTQYLDVLAQATQAMQDANRAVADALAAVRRS